MSKKQPQQEQGGSKREEEIKLLDEAFKSFIDDMKPFVLSLPERRDRQRIALWIKKLCGPLGVAPSERKNRNLYAQILFQMLRKGWIEEPFDEEPPPGGLHILPAYFSRYFDKKQGSFNRAIPKQKSEKTPDWIRGELPSSDSVFAEMRHFKSGTSIEPDSSSSSETPRRSIVKYSSYAENESNEVPLSQLSDSSVSDGSHEADSLDETAEDFSLQYKKSPRVTPPPSSVRRQHDDVSANSQIPTLRDKVQEDRDQRQHLPTRRSISHSPNNGIRAISDENERLKKTIQELQNNVKSVEAKLAEERLMLHRERDTAVQKVLDRKNTEIEGVKSHYRSKTNELEEYKRRQEKKILKLTRDVNQATSRNEKEVEELKAIIQQNKVNAEHELERRVLERVAEFEQEKFDMQKAHSQNIQELLDETNERLKRIENEYLQKIDAVDCQLMDSEKELYQIKRNRDIYKQEKEELELEKEEIKERINLANKELENYKNKVKDIEKERNGLIEQHDKVLRDLRRKTDVTIDSMKKEHGNTASKTSLVISELEGKITHLKQSLEDVELQRKRDLREQDSTHKQEIVRLEVNHDKMIRNLKGDAERTETELQNKLRTAEQTVKEKSSKIVQIEAQLAGQQLQAQTAIENFRNQAEENSKKIFQEMKQQIEKVEGDLEKAYFENNSIKIKAKEETDKLKQNHEQQIDEMEGLHKEEKGRLLKDAETEFESHARESKDELEQTRSKLNEKIKELEENLLIEKERNIKKFVENEQTIRELRDEVIQANSLRKQQLVELGMLRDEEKQNFKHQEESMQVKFRSQLEQQKLNLQKEHSDAMERMLEKTNEKLKQIEGEYALRSERSQQMITELQNQVKETNEKLSREQSETQVRILDLTENYENERQDIKHQHSNVVKSLNQDVELHRSKSRHLERKFHELELQSQESMTTLKLEYEEKIRGLLPNEARMELEETIDALRQQISLMQSRASLLQEELENRDGVVYSHEDSEPAVK